MKLQQLRYICEVESRALNITAAARALFTSQPGLGKQIRMLEDELGVAIFTRNGRQLTGVTPAGRAIIKTAREVLRGAGDIKAMAREFGGEREGRLSVAAAYGEGGPALPEAVRVFRQCHPEVEMRVREGSPRQVLTMAAEGAADLAIATQSAVLDSSSELVRLPCRRREYCILALRGHPLLQSLQSVGRMQERAQDPAPERAGEQAQEPAEGLTLEAIAQHPIITYAPDFGARAQLDAVFAERGLAPTVAFTAADEAGIKAYVRLGAGIGIAAKAAYDPAADRDLARLDAGHLFAQVVSCVVCRRGGFLRGYMYDFIELLAPHLSRDVVEEAFRRSSKAELDALFAGVELPTD